jgi:fructose-1-phosphate kinase PfkB-like protein
MSVVPDPTTITDTSASTATDTATFAGWHLSLNTWDGSDLVDAGNSRNQARAFALVLAMFQMWLRPVRAHGRHIGLVPAEDCHRFNGAGPHLDTTYVVSPGALRIEQMIPGVAQLKPLRPTTMVARPEDLTRFRDELALVPRGHWVVLSGSVPPGIDDDVEFYADLIGWLRFQRQVRVFFNGRKETLRGLLQANVQLDGVSANLEELSFAMGAEIDPIDGEALVQFARRFHTDEPVIFSLGPRHGTFFYHQGKAWIIHVGDPAGEQIIHANGCGDTLVGAFMAAFVNGESVLFAAVLSVCCAVAQLTTTTPALFYWRLVNRLMASPPRITPVRVSQT